jgi:hypothetical protein
MKRLQIIVCGAGDVFDMTRRGRRGVQAAAFNVAAGGLAQAQKKAPRQTARGFIRTRPMTLD